MFWRLCWYTFLELSIEGDNIMGSLFVEVGQCGCQIGVPLNHKLSALYYCNRTRPPNRLHAIMVDTEPKVIRQVATQSPKWLDPAHQIDRDSAIDRFQLLPHPLDHKARNFPVFLDVLFESVGLDVAELAAFCHFL